MQFFFGAYTLEDLDFNPLLFVWIGGNGRERRVGKYQNFIYLVWLSIEKGEENGGELGGGITSHLNKTNPSNGKIC